MYLMVAGMLMFTGSLTAQEVLQPQPQKDYSDEQIDQFASAVVRVLPVQQEAQAKMIKVIEDNDLSLERFNQIATQLQTSGQAEGVDEKDLEKFDQAAGEIEPIQMDMNERVNEVILEEGLSPQLYQEMANAYTSNPKIKQKVDQKLAEVREEEDE